MIVSLKEAILDLKAFCTAHAQINSYYHVNEIVNSYKSNEIVHTTVLSMAKSAVINPTDISVTLQIAVVDKTLKGDENAAEIESNTLQILGDIENYINTNVNWQYSRTVGSPNATKLYDRTLDVVDGWLGTYVLRLMKDNGTCNIPLN